MKGQDIILSSLLTHGPIPIPQPYNSICIFLQNLAVNFCAQIGIFILLMDGTHFENFYNNSINVNGKMINRDKRCIHNPDGHSADGLPTG